MTIYAQTRDSLTMPIPDANPLSPVEPKKDPRLRSAAWQSCRWFRHGPFRSKEFTVCFAERMVMFHGCENTGYIQNFPDTNDELIIGLWCESVKGCHYAFVSPFWGKRGCVLRKVRKDPPALPTFPATCEQVWSNTGLNQSWHRCLGARVGTLTQRKSIAENLLKHFYTTT